MGYRNLSVEEIRILEKKNCQCRDWSRVFVAEKPILTNMHNVTLSGDIFIGVLSGSFVLPGGFYQESGLESVALHNCRIGNGVYIGFVQDYIANYVIDDRTFIKNINCLYVDRESSFGNGTSISVMNESGGREVLIYNCLNAHVAYIYTFYRHNKELIAKLEDMISCYVESIRSAVGYIGKECKIISSGSIKNVYIGNNTSIEGVMLLENGSVNSNEEDPVHLGYNVIANDFIISSGSRITDGVMLKRCFVGQSCKLGHTYSATDSLFFSNCQGENGEAASIFAGPFTVTHHKSTLLIAGMFSFMNAGSGSNQSNHMYKLGAIHQGIVERGGKTTSNSYILWPARIGAFSLIMGRHTSNADTSCFPFSYLIENDDQTYLIPGVNLRSVGTIRDAQKFPKRDVRKDSNLLDNLNYNLLSPYTVQKMFDGLCILEKLIETCGSTSATYSYQGCIIKSSSAQKGIYFYNLAITKFLGNSLISKIKQLSFTSFEELKQALQPSSCQGKGLWRDIAGLLVPENEVNIVIEEIISNPLTSVESINKSFQDLHFCYYQMEWVWAFHKIWDYFDLSFDSLKLSDLLGIIESWRSAVVELDELIYFDAKKEFSLSSRIGFGVDGNRYTQQVDFESVRGAFETNSFVSSIQKHIEVKVALGKEIIDRLKQLS